MKSDTTTVVDVRAVDVGYFNTKLSLGRKFINGIPGISTLMFPSLAPRLAAGVTPTMALQKKPDGVWAEVGSAVYFVGKDSPTFISGREPREVLPDYSTSEKYLALLRGAFHYMYQDCQAKNEMVIKHLVLGLPFGSTEERKDALIRRATGEHLLPAVGAPGSKRRITVEKTSVIYQPQGALLAQGSSSGVFLVVDSGGGTLDWFVVNGGTSNWQRSGAYPKSMLACGHAVADTIDPTWRDNVEIMSRIDHAIRQKASNFSVGGHVYDMAEFTNQINSVLDEAVGRMVATV